MSVWNGVIILQRGRAHPGYGIAASARKEFPVFEVITRQKISPELMTEVFADLIRKRFVIVYLCEQEIAMATFVPGENEEEGKICATDFYSYDMSHMIEILDFEQVANKSVEEIHNRIMSEIRQQKKEIMIEKAFAGMHKSVQQEPDLNMNSAKRIWRK